MDSLANDDKMQKRGLGLLVVVTLGVIVCVCSMDILFSGDIWSDLNVLISGKNFAEYGFLKLRFLPVLQNTPPSETPHYYLHYPPLGDIFNGLLRIIGLESIFVYRFIAGISSLIGVVCLYIILTRLTCCLVALCGMLFFVTSPYFWNYSCTIHSHAYNIMYIGLFLLFFFKAMDDSGSTRHWVGCWIVLFAHSLTSFEFILFLSAFAGIYIIFSGQLKKYYLHLILLAAAPFAAVALHFLQNCWAIGWDNALADNLGFKARHGGFVPERFAAMAKMPYLLHFRTIAYFSFSWLAMLAIVGMCPLLLKKVKNNANLGAMLWACLIASGSWFIFMPAHAYIQTHTVGQFMLLVIISAGIIISTLWRILADRQYDKGVRFFALSMLIVIAGFHSYTVAKIIYAHTHKYSMLKVLKNVGCLLPENSGVLVNAEIMGPYLTYYSGRPVRHVTESSELVDKIEEIKSFTSERLNEFYFVYANNDEYMKDDLFIKLASTCPGYRKNYTFPKRNIVKPVFLFDLRPIWDPDTAVVSSDQAKEQIDGHFPLWQVTK